MLCRKCKAEIPDESKYCHLCGIRQDTSRRTKSRGNGTGCVFRRGTTYTAMITVGYKPDADGRIKRITRSKSGFRTKKEALEYLPKLANMPKEKKSPTLQALYDAWLPTHRAGKDTMNCYKAAWRYYAPIAYMRVQDITVDELQDCIDECPHGKRTLENMKTLCSLLYKYAIPRNIATLNMGEYLIVSGKHGSKEGLPMDALDNIRRHIADIPGADYVVCQCYLGFRPSELLDLTVEDYNREERAFVGGAKTDAGTNRTVTVSPKIQPIVDRLTAGRTSGPVFCAEDGGRLPIKDYRSRFYEILDQCGIDNPITEIKGKKFHKYTPHSCRHTFATLLKGVTAADKDKLELIGHTSTEMLRHYQDVSFDDLRKVTDAL